MDTHTKELEYLLNNYWCVKEVKPKEYFEIKPCYHTTNERIKKYYPLDLQNMCRKIGIGWEELVPEIIIGPESTQSQPILQDYLRDNGLDGLAERVSMSNCPLRRSPA